MEFLFNKMKIFLIFCTFCLSQVYGNPQLRTTSAPYISGDTYRSFADYLFDETTTDFEPSAVNYGDVIFVKSNMLHDYFIIKHPYIQNPYVLVTHNSDDQAPGQFANKLEDSKILAWYAQNIENFSHPKLIHLPIGLANRCWGHGSIDSMNKVISMSANKLRNHLLYLNIATATYPKERQQVYEIFKNSHFCLASGIKPFEKYLEDLANCKFVLSPRGNGIDCHRTWESLYLGSIPIVKTSSLDPMYEELPVLIVDSWEQITEEFLKKKYEEMTSKKYNYSKLDASYWYDQITKYKQKKQLNNSFNFDNKTHSNFYFSHEPIDVVIPCALKDSEILSLCVQSIRDYCSNVRRIIVISSEKLTDKAEWFNEDEFPFSKNDIALALTQSEEAAEKYLANRNNRSGWYFQQLLKIYSPLVIPNISSNVLVVDADVIFLNPVSFQEENGAPLFNVTEEYHLPYFNHIDRFLPGLSKVNSKYSGIAHHMLFQYSILKELFQTVEGIHKQEFWKTFCNLVDPSQLYNSGASEYEIYFNFALTKCQEAKIRMLKTKNITSLGDLKKLKKSGFSYIACHSYERKSIHIKKQNSK